MAQKMSGEAARAVLGVLDAVEDRLSVAALRVAQAAQAKSQARRTRALASAKLTLREANVLLERNMAGLRKGKGVVGPDVAAKTTAEDLHREAEWLAGGRE